MGGKLRKGHVPETVFKVLGAPPPPHLPVYCQRPTVHGNQFTSCEEHEAGRVTGAPQDGVLQEEGRKGGVEGHRE